MLRFPCFYHPVCHLCEIPGSADSLTVVIFVGAKFFKNFHHVEGVDGPLSRRGGMREPSSR